MTNPASTPTNGSLLLWLALAISFLSGATDVKIADIQSVEVVVLLALVAMVFRPQGGLRIEGPRVVLALVPHVFILFFLLALTSVLSLRLHFYPIPGTGPLKQPPWATFVRLFEIIVSVSSMFIVALAIGRDPVRLKKVFSAYMAAAYVSAAWGLGCFLLWGVSGVRFSGITDLNAIPRIRGLFVEGGPFGLYVAGALLIQAIRYFYLRYIGKTEFVVGSGLLVLALAGTQSKSAVFLILFVGLFYMLFSRRFVVVVLLAMLAIPLFVTSDVFDGLSAYMKSRNQFSVIAFTNFDDRNIVMGRVMASVLLPRIIATHPFLGVGIGNYSLVRNDPFLLRGLPQTSEWDLHGLGLLGYMAELGIPLALYAMFIYLKPFLAARRTRPWIGLLSIYPLGAALFGVQLNFAYPWVVLGMALAAIAIHQSAPARAMPVPVPVPAGRMRNGSRRSDGGIKGLTGGIQ